MARFDGSLARTLDFNDSAAPLESGAADHRPKPAALAAAEPRASAWLVHGGCEGRCHEGGDLRRAISGGRSSAAGGGVSPLDKYQTLEHRRRQAQIRARRLLGP
jgi:hypothetical protein